MSVHNTHARGREDESRPRRACGNAEYDMIGALVHGGVNKVKVETVILSGFSKPIHIEMSVSAKNLSVHVRRDPSLAFRAGVNCVFDPLRVTQMGNHI